MKVTVTLRYHQKTVVEIEKEVEVPDGYTAGTLASGIIKEHERSEGICFAGACIAVLVNGRLSSQDELLHDGDEVRIIPVASGG